MNIKTLTLIFSLFFTASLFAQSGTTGDLTWSISKGTLTINGSGRMPDYYLLDNTTTPPWYSYRSSITSLNIGENVTRIGDEAFYDFNRLTSVTIPNSVTSIGHGAFYRCRSLSKVVLEDGTKSLILESSPFSETSPIEYIYLGRNIFYSTNESPFKDITTLTELTIGNGVTNIGNGLLSGCSSLTELTIGNGVTSIGNGVLAGCSSLTELTLPFIGSKSDATGNNAMLGVLFGTKANGNMQEVQQGNSTYYLPKNLKKISLTAPATRIADGALSNCTMLEELHIANTVMGLGKNALYSCNALRHIYSHWEYPPTAFNNSTFEAVNKFICTIHVPIGSKQYYSIADGWKEFNNITEDITSVRMINDDDNHLQAYIADGNIVVSGLKRGENIYIYNLGGVCIYTRIIENETEHINVEYLPTDVYVVKTGKKSAKLRL